MKRFTLLNVALFLALLGPLRASTFAPGAAYELMIEGVSCGYVQGISGGDLVATVAVDSTTGKKNISATGYTPIKFGLTVPLAAPMLNLLRDAVTNLKPIRTMQLVRYDSTDKLVSTLNIGGARLIEIRVPTLIARSIGSAAQSATPLTVVLVAETVAPGTRNGSPVLANATPRPNGANSYQGPLLGGFRFTLGGIVVSDGTVNSFTIKPSFAPLASAGSPPPASPAPGQFPNLIVGLGNTANSLPSWEAWRDEFIGQGLNDDAHEKTGSVDYLATDLSTVLLSLQVSHLGLVRVGANENNSATEAELYFESMTVQASAAATTTPPKIAKPLETQPKKIAAANGLASSSAASTAAEAKPATPPDAAASAGAEQSTGAAPVVAASSGPAGSKIATTSPAGAAGTGGANPTAASTGEPAKTAPTVAKKLPGDQGAHDIAEFPRPNDVLRKSYSISREKTKTRESAAYAGAITVEAATAFYAESLTADGWTETSRVENNGATGRLPQVSMNWTKPDRTALIIINEVAGGTIEVSASVNTTVK